MHSEKKLWTERQNDKIHWQTCQLTIRVAKAKRSRTKNRM